jgi:hypothetical protein
VNPRIEQLRQAVEKACECKVRHARSVAVIEGFEGRAVWDGVVETFDLEGHPKAKKCYAFRFVEDGRPVIKTVLGVPPADSPENAVRVGIAAKAKG